MPYQFTINFLRLKPEDESSNLSQTISFEIESCFDAIKKIVVNKLLEARSALNLYECAVSSISCALKHLLTTLIKLYEFLKNSQ
jgi:hypothetical protein